MWRGYSLSALLHTALLLILLAGLPTLPAILELSSVDDPDGEQPPAASEDTLRPRVSERPERSAFRSGDREVERDKNIGLSGDNVLPVEVLIVRTDEPFPPALSGTSTPGPRPEPAHHTAPTLSEAPPQAARTAVRSEAGTSASAQPETALVPSRPNEGSAPLADPARADVASPAVAAPRSAEPQSRLQAILMEVATLDRRLGDAVRPEPAGNKSSERLEREKRIYDRVQEAARRGYPHAQYNLARMLLQGRGAERDPEQARTWLERSAERGYAPAQLLLGHLDAGALGGKPDLGRADFWWTLAERRENPAAARARTLINPLMDSGDIVASRRLKAQWQQVTSALAPEVNDPQDLKAVNEQLRERASKGDAAAVLSALLQGADADSRDDGGRTAMINAAWRGRKEILDILLSNGADNEVADDEGRTALMWGAINGHSEIVTQLIDAGSNPNRADKNGITALMRAAWNGHRAVVEELLRAGADPVVRDRNGLSALDHAAREGHTAVVGRLRAAK